jgi:hypothetical protein
MTGSLHQPNTYCAQLSAGYGTPHPECGPDEVFICYEHLEATTDMQLPGKRFGSLVFDDFGNDVTAVMESQRIVPVFANKAEHAKRYSKIA